jgi:hypothetical protein
MQMQPRHGGRALLQLQGSSADRVSYTATVFDPLQQWSGAASVATATGEVTLQALEGAPAWLCELVRTTLRGAWRNSSAEGWPRRLARWRPMPADQGQS